MSRVALYVMYMLLGIVLIACVVGIVVIIADAAIDVDSIEKVVPTEMPQLLP